MNQEVIMITLKNDFLEVVLENKGAEIIKIVGQSDQINYMWRRDPIQWGSSAPILFPIVGALQNNECRIDGKTYSMTQHGFSRHSEYRANQLSDTEVVFTLEPNEEILKQYPYLFKLEVTYSLNDNVLACNLKVTNTDNKEIYFQIGGHPAFACPFMEGESSNDYYLEFSDNETLARKVLNLEKKGISHETVSFLDNEKRFFVRQELFSNDTIVLENFKSNKMALKSLNHNKSLVVHMDGFTHLGIWAAKHVGGLIAIEPWFGHSDYDDFCGEFKDKEGIVSLKENEQFEAAFKIEINQ